MSVSKIKGKPKDVEGFLGGANKEDVKPVAREDVTEDKGSSVSDPKADFMTAPPPPPRVQKNVRLRKDLAEKLTREALDLTLKHGVKVHEGSIIDFLLKQRYGIDD